MDLKNKKRNSLNRTRKVSKTLGLSIFAADKKYSNNRHNLYQNSGNNSTSQKNEDGSKKSIAFDSSILKGIGKKSMGELELIAVLSGRRKNMCHIYGKQLLLNADQQALASLVKRNGRNRFYSALLTRSSDKLSHLHKSVQLVAGRGLESTKHLSTH